MDISKKNIYYNKQEIINATNQFVFSVGFKDANLGHKIAKILFLSGIKSIEHNVYENAARDFNHHCVPTHKCCIINSPTVNSEILHSYNKKVKPDRPILWSLLDLIGVSVTGSSSQDSTTTSNIKHKNLLADIVLHFRCMTTYFELKNKP